MRNVEYWRWRYRNPATGKMCRTIFPFTVEEAAARYPNAERIEGTMVLREVEERGKSNGQHPRLGERDSWRDSSLELERGLDVDEVPMDSLPGGFRDSFV